MKIAKFTILPIGCLIILIEIILRVFFYEQLKTQIYPLTFQKDSIGFSFIPNQKAKICIPSIEKEFTLNNHGYYGTSFNDIKKEGTIRIAFVGNSVTEGIRLNETNNYPLILQQILKKNGYEKYEIINCSIFGVGNDLKNYKHILYTVSKYNLDFVFLDIGIQFQNENEFREIYHNYVIRHSGSNYSRQYSINMVNRVEKMHFFTTLYDISYIFRAYCKRFYENNICSFSDDIRTYRQKISSAPDIIPYAFSYTTSIKLLKNLDRTLKLMGSRLVILNMEKDKLLINSMKSEKIDCISLGIQWRRSMIHKHDGHPNGKGHKIIALHLYNKLKEFNYIQK
jgi:hypothetical protein